MGLRLKFTHEPLRQTWLTMPSPDCVTQRHWPSGTPAQELPPLPVPMCPARQSAQAEQVSPAPQVPSPQLPPLGQVGPHAPKPPHMHIESQVRERVCIALPVGQLRVSESIAPAMHSPSSTHCIGPHVQSAWQRRSWRPQLPQSGPMSMSPGSHWRGSMHSHVVGASQSLHTPSVHDSVPVPQSVMHARAAVRPIASSVSSQSWLTGTPSPSSSGGGVVEPASISSVGAPASASRGSPGPPPSAQPKSASDAATANHLTTDHLVTRGFVHPADGATLEGGTPCL